MNKQQSSDIKTYFFTRRGGTKKTHLKKLIKFFHFGLFIKKFLVKCYPKIIVYKYILLEKFHGHRLE